MRAGGWGTRAGAYAGGDAPTEIPAVPAPAPERLALPSASSAVVPGTATLVRETPAVAPALTSLIPTAVAIPARRRRPNPLAAIPYLIGLAVLALEAMFLV